MFYVRINKIRIIKNGELLGKGEIQVMSFINHSEISFPSIEEFFQTTDTARQAELVKNAIDQVIQSRVLMPIQKVKDKSILTFGDTGYITYKSSTIPEDFSWQILAVEKDQKTRDNAKLIESIATKENVTTLMGALSQLAAISNPVSTAITTLYDVVSKSIFALSANDKDDQIGYYISSFIRDADYPYVTRDRQDVTDLTGNMFIDYTFFGHD